MSKAYFMGIDTGTNSSKGVIMDDCGQILAVHSTQHEMTNPKPGHYEHDAEKDWWGDFCTISKALIAKTGIDPKDIRAVGASALEGVGYSIAQQIAIMRSHENVPIDRIIAVGGGTQNPVWMQIIADILGTPVSTPAVTVGACFGDALMAALAVKHPGFESYSALTNYIHGGKTYLPDAEKHQQYCRFQAIYDKLYLQTLDLMHMLSGN